MSNVQLKLSSGRSWRTSVRLKEGLSVVKKLFLSVISILRPLWRRSKPWSEPTMGLTCICGYKGSHLAAQLVSSGIAFAMMSWKAFQLEIRSIPIFAIMSSLSASLRHPVYLHWPPITLLCLPKPRHRSQILSSSPQCPPLLSRSHHNPATHPSHRTPQKCIHNLHQAPNPKVMLAIRTVFHREGMLNPCIWEFSVLTPINFYKSLQDEKPLKVALTLGTSCIARSVTRSPFSMVLKSHCVKWLDLRITPQSLKCCDLKGWRTASQARSRWMRQWPFITNLEITNSVLPSMG